MDTYKYTVGTGKHKIEAAVVTVGKNITVTIGGGDVYHIGAVAVAAPRPSLKKDGSISATASVICLMGHKDDEPARKAALLLASVFKTTAAVAVGLHIDDPTKEDFTLIQANFTSMLDLLSRQKYGL